MSFTDMEQGLEI